MLYPALDVRGVDGDLALAAVDDYSPTAAEERRDLLTIFFPDSARRDQARDALARQWPGATAIARDVDDEDWARRSQGNLAPMIIGRLTISPSPDGRARSLPSLSIVIQPSMGFGTGHHASTRLCLLALQTLDLTDRLALDIGTGSGILAIAARRLGADLAVGIDSDPDAIQAAIENLRFNETADRVRFSVEDLTSAKLPAADVVTANLTGALLRRNASLLLRLLRPSGVLIISGLLAEERDQVAAAFEAAETVWEANEDGWIGLMFRAKKS